MLVTADTPTLPPVDLQGIEESLYNLEMITQFQIAELGILIGCILAFIFLFMCKRG